MRKGFLVLSGDGNAFNLNSTRELYKFSKAYAYSFRQILVGIKYEGQWVGVNHQIQMR